MQKHHNLIIVGAGASGLMCAIQAAYRGLNVLVLEKNQKAGMKILVSGGGRCNFTNLWADPREHYLSENPHFCISALKRYSPYDFVDMVERHQIGYHEKTLGQQFCNDSSKQIQKMLLDECEQLGVEIKLQTSVTDIDFRENEGFLINSNKGQFQSKKLVLASGGLSMPKISSDIAFRTAEKMGLTVKERRAGLVPFTWNNKDKACFESLSGISFFGMATVKGQSFREAILFTHRGLSGPAMLQISSYWNEGDSVYINFLPDIDITEWLELAKQQSSQQKTTKVLKTKLPNRLVDLVCGLWFEDCKIGSLSSKELTDLSEKLSNWEFKPGGTEGYRTAEVTLGGISTDEFSSKTFESHKIPNLYAIGEALDVTGWLGGYNFQWAWASAYCCAQSL